MRLITEFAQDVRYGRRLLAKNPGITLIAILVTFARVLHPSAACD